MKRRLFIKKSIYGGAGLLMTGRMIACNKDGDSPINPDDKPIDHPAITPDPGIDLYGSILDDMGNPVQGVVVSDGYQCVVTDAKGVYQMTRDPRALTVFFSTPAAYEVKRTGTISTAANFFTALSSQSKRYNFTMKRLSAVEDNFSLVCIGDPQVASAVDIERYSDETIADLKAFVESQTQPCYGLVLGDTVGDQPQFFTRMRNLTGSVGLPYFTTIGNHDKTGGNSTTPRDANAYTAVFGPVNHSWNRGKVHFISLDNVIFENNSSYRGGLEDYQIEWLRQDLSYVSKDKLIIIYYHIPIRNDQNFKNRAAFFSLLQNYPNVHFMVGHTHYHENFQIGNGGNTIYEHIHGAACGAWWKSTVNCDGTPNGYAVYSVQGTEIKNCYYKATRYDKGFQIRLHRGPDLFGGQYGNYSYGKGTNDIIANIWNADTQWKLEAYEDGVKAGNLSKLNTVIDAFAAGYHVGVLNRIPGNYGATGNGQNKHAYIHSLKNPNAKEIEIRATDPFGNIYSQTEIITDLKTAQGY
ncbi:calcineurin-like phosphoesterase family protein [Proteiniphilum sp. UBA5384]|uniref:calcineurin-like phosphoesterase family protein n=1 Tax=Proteiniphilum sp. UBA5384 TaxID=1947279 RepID=UPI0025DAA8BF|nr:calcineurin-like phosphoesterase family protein [Proteiniphilum sp. UBA5384]